VWVANYSGNSISEISSSGAVLSKGSYTGGGIDHPQAIAIDGTGNVWIANYRGLSITELAGATATAPGSALSPSGGLGADADLLEAYAIAVDASGNLWISNFGSNTLTQFIGLASPVRTPLLTLPVAP
jgi:DNA-binding beta-propeller fold protein YncE